MMVLPGSLAQISSNREQSSSDGENSSAAAAGDYGCSDEELGGYYYYYYYYYDSDGESSDVEEVLDNRNLAAAVGVLYEGEDVIGKVNALNLKAKLDEGSQCSFEDTDVMLQIIIKVTLIYLNLGRNDTYLYALCAFYVPLPFFLQEGDVLRRVLDRNRYPNMMTPQTPELC